MEIRGLTIVYSKNKAKHNANAKFINDAINGKEILKLQLVFYKEKAKSLMLRSKTRWTEKGEKPTKYFFNLEKRNYNRKNSRIRTLERKTSKQSRRNNERNRKLL